MQSCDYPFPLWPASDNGCKAAQLAAAPSVRQFGSFDPQHPQCDMYDEPAQLMLYGWYCLSAAPLKAITDR
jgi:hypothetical protein